MNQQNCDEYVMLLVGGHRLAYLKSAQLSKKSLLLVAEVDFC